VTANERPRETPNTDLYQYIFAAICYRQTPADSIPSLDHSRRPFSGRRKDVPHSTGESLNNSKGKNPGLDSQPSGSYQEPGEDPLEAARGRVPETNPTTTKDDSVVDADDAAPKSPLGPTRREPSEAESPVRKESGQWNRLREPSDSADLPATSSGYRIGDEDEFRNVWGK
jgi:hypothetical protein